MINILKKTVTWGALIGGFLKISAFLLLLSYVVTAPQKCDTRIFQLQKDFGAYLVKYDTETADLKRAVAELTDLVNTVKGVHDPTVTSSPGHETDTQRHGKP